MQFQIGDVVQLKSGGQPMTVTCFASNTGGQQVVSCSWFDGTTARADAFPPDALKIANPKGSPASARPIR
jgi:uncharacterized protein YodC (DUF2158 family)